MQINLNEIKETFAASFEAHKVEGLDSLKAFNRATLVTDDDGSGLSLFDVERHRGVLGAQYVKGVPLSAFETYWMRFAFDPATGHRKELEQVRPSEYSVDAAALADEWSFESERSFSFEPVDEGYWEARELTSGAEGTVRDEGDVRAFGRASARPTDVRDYFEMVLGEDVADGLASEADALARHLRDAAEEEAVQVWRRTTTRLR